jgi:ABC-2 type transport system ATP-binding protein
MVSGFMMPDDGQITLCGYDVTKQSQIAQSALGYLPEAPNGFGHLKVIEFLHFCGQARGFFGEKLLHAVDHVSQSLDLFSVLRRPLNQLSKGWRQRAWVAQAIIHEPRILVLDEPTDGLDPNQKDLVRELVKDLKKDRTIILSTHILEEAEELCDRVVILNKGRCVEDAPLSALVDGQGRLSTRFRELTHGHDSRLSLSRR